MIEFQNISKSYAGALAVDGLNLKIERGEFVVLIGASGSGKSTTLKMINRMESHDAGKIIVDGREINSFKVRDLRLRMGYAIQSVGLFPHWTVERNIACVPQMLGWSKQKITDRVTTLLQLFDLDPDTYRSRYPHQLSGGQQQRVGVAPGAGGRPGHRADGRTFWRAGSGDPGGTAAGDQTRPSSLRQDYRDGDPRHRRSLVAGNKNRAAHDRLGLTRW